MTRVWCESLFQALGKGLRMGEKMFFLRFPFLESQFAQVIFQQEEAQIKCGSQGASRKNLDRSISRRGRASLADPGHTQVLFIFQPVLFNDCLPSDEK